MSNSIKLSPKHGLNPTIPVCFFCGEEKNEVVLLGHIGDKRKGEDLEAPRRAILDYTPCENCTKKFSEGVLLIEVNTSPEFIGLPISENVYPTGRFVVIKPDALNGDYKAGMRALIYKKDFVATFGRVD